jgi:tetratricopeptide (TPR) repeat protein
MCPILKKLSNTLQPFHQVVEMIFEILKSPEKRANARVLGHLLSYAENQFGNQVAGIHYRERQDGERIDNWTVDIVILYGIYEKLIACYTDGEHLGRMIVFPLLEKKLKILNLWLNHIDNSNASSRLDEGQTDTLLKYLFRTENNIATIAINTKQFDIAEGHCQQSLAHSRRMRVEGVQKTTFMFNAIETYCGLRFHQGNFSDAVLFAEEGYNLVVEAYDPVHPQVQEAAGLLIKMLIRKKDLFNAERFAEVTYSNLRDSKNGMDQNSEVMALGSYNLANIIYQQDGDFMKAENLARDAVRIRTLIDSKNHNVGISCDLLGNLLCKQSKLGDETRKIYERALAIFKRSEGPDGINSATGNQDFGTYYTAYTRFKKEVYPSIQSLT